MVDSIPFYFDNPPFQSRILLARYACIPHVSQFRTSSSTQYSVQCTVNSVQCTPSTVYIYIVDTVGDYYYSVPLLLHFERLLPCPTLNPSRIILNRLVRQPRWRRYCIPGQEGWGGGRSITLHNISTSLSGPLLVYSSHYVPRWWCTTMVAVVYLIQKEVGVGGGHSTTSY